MAQWLNTYGLIFVIAILIPNIVYTVKTSKNPPKQWRNPTLEKMEQAGRYGCMAFMIFNIPQLCKGFWFGGAEIVYLVVDIAILAIYLIGWAFLFDKVSVTRALILSILPSILFLASGILMGSVLLVAFAVVFAASHITISYKSVFVQLMAQAEAEEEE